MFIVVNVNNGVYSVKDTFDNVVEEFTNNQLASFEKEGINIIGFTGDIDTFKPLNAEDLQKTLRTYLVSQVLQDIKKKRFQKGKDVLRYVVMHYFELLNSEISHCNMIHEVEELELISISKILQMGYGNVLTIVTVPDLPQYIRNTYFGNLTKYADDLTSSVKEGWVTISVVNNKRILVIGRKNTVC